MIRGYLAEPYDGIGQYIMVGLSRGSTSVAYKARVASGDFNSGRTFPVGTPIHLTMYRGSLEAHLGSKGGICGDSFNRSSDYTWGRSDYGTDWEHANGREQYHTVNGSEGVFTSVLNSVSGHLNKLPVESATLPIELLTTQRTERYDQKSIGWMWWINAGSNFDETFVQYAHSYVSGFNGEDKMHLFLIDYTDGIGETETEVATFRPASPYPWDRIVHERIRFESTRMLYSQWFDGDAEPGSFEVIHNYQQPLVDPIVDIGVEFVGYNFTGNISYIYIDEVLFAEGIPCR
jgi:hypothetical protein